MFDFFRLFTPELAFFTLVFIVAPSIVAIFSRISLNLYLKKLIKEVTENSNSEKINRLKEQVKATNQKLYGVNTLAILEEFYSKEKFSVLGFTLSCEKWDYYCKILPNLLISFGLFGTFLGITSNLASISSIIGPDSTSGLSDISPIIKCFPRIYRFNV